MQETIIIRYTKMLRVQCVGAFNASGNMQTYPDLIAAMKALGWRGASVVEMGEVSGQYREVYQEQ